MMRKANRNSNVASHMCCSFLQKKAVQDLFLLYLLLFLVSVSLAFSENVYKSTVPK